MKTCPKCVRELPLSYFHRNSKLLSGRTTYCKKCIAHYSRQRYEENPAKCNAIKRRWARANPDKVWANHLKRKYGISLEAYHALIGLQGNRCAICSDVMAPIHVDHNHRTGKVRGLLCRTCNFMLGNCKESPKILRDAVAYLAKHKTKPKS